MTRNIYIKNIVEESLFLISKIKHPTKTNLLMNREHSQRNKTQSSFENLRNKGEYKFFLKKKEKYN